MPDNFKPVSPSQFSFVNEFQAGILKLILALPSGTGVFAPTCLVHCLSGQNSFHTLQAAGTSLAASLAAFFTVYVAVFGAGLFYILRLMSEPPRGAEGGLPHQPMRAAGIMPAPAMGVKP